MQERGPDVFSFQDYRAYLRAHYLEHKARYGFSFRSFSRRTGLKSPNYLKLVMDGERNLTPEMAERFCIGLRLRGASAEYFQELVAFNQARTLDERAERYARLRRFRRYREAHRLDLAHDAYHSRWYIPAVRELITALNFRDDPAWIARRLVPSIKPEEARLALETLLELGMVVRDAEGKLRQSTPLVTTGAEVRSLHLANFHRSMMAHAAASLDRVAAEQRDISSLTLCMSREGLARIKRRIQKFRGELLALSEQDPQPEQVVQVNFQLFPLSSVDDEVSE